MIKRVSVDASGKENPFIINKQIHQSLLKPQIILNLASHQIYTSFQPFLRAMPMLLIIKQLRKGPAPGIKSNQSVSATNSRRTREKAVALTYFTSIIKRTSYCKLTSNLPCVNVFEIWHQRKQVKQLPIPISSTPRPYNPSNGLQLVMSIPRLWLDIRKMSRKKTTIGIR